MNAKIAYFSMEIAIDPSIPTYSGGLGVLAGDTIRSAADLKVPMCAVSLVYRKGYFCQKIDRSGWQREEPRRWSVEAFFDEQPARATVAIEGRNVALRAWRRNVEGEGGSIVPAFFLDTDLPENSDYHRSLTDWLYGGDDYYRLCQEVVLGVGGVRMLRALGFDAIERFHMNEGHAAFLALELLDESAARAGRDRVTREDVDEVRRRCVFTTHTPVPAGHDRFPMDMVRRAIGGQQNFFDMSDLFCPEFAGRVVESDAWREAGAGLFRSENRLNMTYLALNASHYVNGVAKKHAEVSKLMFADYQFDAITNGVHAATWVAPPFQSLFDRYIAGWRADNFNLRYALKIPRNEIWRAHEAAKASLLERVNQRAPAVRFRSDLLTIGFARRAAAYKRGALLLSDAERLRRIAQKNGGLQIVYAGKAHPKDEDGKRIIQHIVGVSKEIGPEVRIVYLENYDMGLAQSLVAGADLWLNTPQPPLEASGTSGMKAALNAVPSLSVLDGWWIEGCIEGVTGWGIGEPRLSADDRGAGSEGDADSLYAKLEQAVDLFYFDRNGYIDVMRHAAALNGSFFNTQRMVQQYVLEAYFL